MVPLKKAISFARPRGNDQLAPHEYKKAKKKKNCTILYMPHSLHPKENASTGGDLIEFQALIDTRTVIGEVRGEGYEDDRVAHLRMEKFSREFSFCYLSHSLRYVSLL